MMPFNYRQIRAMAGALILTAVITVSLRGCHGHSEPGQAHGDTVAAAADTVAAAPAAAAAARQEPAPQRNPWDDSL